MIPRCVVGRGITGAVRYILGEGRDAETGEHAILAPGDISRVDWIGGTGFGFNVENRADAELARRIMEFDSLNQGSRTKLCEKDCVHIALGWRPAENPTREEMERSALSALKALGMENAKAIFASHTDEGYKHVHIVASKINPATGRAFDLRGDFLKLSKWAEVYEREHGGVVCVRREDANRLRDAIIARDAHAVIEAMTEQRATFTAADLDRTLAKQIRGIRERAHFAEQVKDRYGAASLSEVERQRKDDDKRASSMMAEGNFYDALQMYEAKKAISWTQNQDQARAALVRQWAADTAESPEKARFVFAYTNVDVAQLNADLRKVRQARGELGADHVLPTAEGELPFARGDRLQITATEKASGLYNGMIGTVEKIKGSEVTVKFDGKQPILRTFDAESFSDFRYGYAGTIYKGQGRTLDQTYLYHSEHWRSAASYVALTRHRDKASLFVARNTAANVRQLACQMARVDDRRAASHFFNDEDSGSIRAAAPGEVLANLGDFFAKPVQRSRPPRAYDALKTPTTSAKQVEPPEIDSPPKMPPMAEEERDKQEQLRRFKADLERSFSQKERGRAR
jgi:hypothetical protein